MSWSSEHVGRRMAECIDRQLMGHACALCRACQLIRDSLARGEKMQTTRVRKFGTEQFHSVAHEPGRCGFCVAGCDLVSWKNEGDTVFLEDDKGEVRELVALCLGDGERLGLECRAVSPDEARATIAAECSS